MWIKFWNVFTKITAWPIQKIKFGTKVCYEDKSLQNRHIKGPAVIVSNHTSVFDYAVLLFVFWSRDLHTLIAELQFEKPILGRILKWLGGIRVDRNSFDFSFIAKSERILKNGGVILAFPEGRIPLETEEKPLEFKSSAAYIALSAGVPVVPVYTEGNYGSGKARVIVGVPMRFDELINSDLPDKEIITRANDEIRNKVIELGRSLNEKTEKSC